MAKPEQKSLREAHILRERAEQQLRDRGPDVSEMSEAEVRALVHELQVHLIELELKNAELRQSDLRHRTDQFAQQAGELEQQQREFRTLADNVPALFSYVDREQRYRYVNRRYEAYFHLPAEEILGKTVAELLGPEQFEGVRLHVEAALGGQEVAYKADFEFPDGIRSMHVRYVPDRGERDDIRGFFALVSDITELNQARDRLTESEQRLHLALQEAGGGAWDWDLKRNQAWWSPEMYRLWGVEPDTRMTLENSMEIIHEQDRDTVRNAIEVALARNGKYRTKFRIQHPIRGERWMASRGRVICDASGRAIRMRGITLDITTQRRAEEKVRQSETRMRAILNTATDTIITIDDRGVIVDVNPATERMFGYAREELVGQNISVLMPEPYRSEHDDYISRYLRTGEAHIIGIGREGEGRRKDGTIFPIDLAVSDVEGLGLFTGIIRDISERKQIERNLQKSRDDLRTVSSELMLTEERERQQLAQDLHDGLGQALFLVNRKLSELSLRDQTVDEIRSVLDAATKTVNALTFELSPPILRDLGLRPAIRWLARDLKKRYGLSVEIEDDNRPFEVDERVATVTFRSVRELLINVAKHAQTNAASVRMTSADHFAEITVEDQGRGFDLAAQSGQVEAGHFGLFSIRERLEYLGGRMTIRSAPGQGTSMTLTMPLEGRKAASG